MKTDALVARLRAVGAELANVEVKTAAGGLPKTVVETLSAFANGDGGVLILGLDEESGFVPALGFQPRPIRDALVSACSEGVLPALRVPIEIEAFEGSHLVRADIAPLDPLDKPCHVAARGAYQGSFIRSGDGDLRLTHYEVTQLLANRSQPLHDTEPVERATLDDLDGALVDSLLRRLRRRSPRSFAGLSEADALVRVGAAVRDGHEVRPTVGGLLCLGNYPQQFYPQLFVSFVVLPGNSMGEAQPDGTRFLDNLSVTGPIPHMVADATAALVRNMRSASVVRGVGRADRYDYPIEVFRELIVNALMHRDYGPLARGTQVHVELYPDRLVLKSPGGIYGAVRVEELGTEEQVSSSRNATLSQLLADVELPDQGGQVVSENRGSGLPRVVASLRQAGMSPPAFDVAPGRVTVTVPQHALLSVDVIDWIATLGLGDMSDAQNLALAIMHSTGRVSNGMLQAWGIDRHVAGDALRDLVERNIATVSGGRRYATYRLLPAGPPAVDTRIVGPAELKEPGAHATGIAVDFDAVKQAIRAGHTTARDISETLEMNYHAVLRRLRALQDRGEVQALKPRNSRSQSYRLIEPDHR
ncbi:hypothetical protein HH308_24005 [Gordonia sp. TBRC 11910]|uniref:Schlafen AlbA-2 domain-containing protein n=1 Tax=Gordonia asplenii TaxID=2725283 RepID=A0A848L9N3_9ACTN|nr:ATP-binding protein [Gordonia asplenii]NMO04288.1 hypothetical protein [Gordonia asplenii]